MKVSELVSILNQQIKENGDMDVLVYYECDLCSGNPEENEIFVNERHELIISV